MNREIKELRALIVDIVGPQDKWPWKLKPYFFGRKHPKNPMRYGLVSFLLVNGVDKETIQEWFLMAYNLDREARNHIFYLLYQRKAPFYAWHTYAKITEVYYPQ